jgi:hypothetical protein
MTQRADTEAPHYHATAALEAEIAPLRPRCHSLYSRIFLYHTVSARGLEPSTELLGLFDGVERPDLGTVEYPSPPTQHGGLAANDRRGRRGTSTGAS